MNETGGTRRRRSELWLGCASLPLLYVASFVVVAVLWDWLESHFLPDWLETTFKIVYYLFLYAYGEWDSFRDVMDWILDLVPVP